MMPIHDYADNINGYGVGLAIDAAAGRSTSKLCMMSLQQWIFLLIDGADIRSALPLLSGEAYASAAGVLANASGATRSAVNNRLQQAFGGTAVDQLFLL